MAKKVTKKTNRKLKRQVRKTMGALLMMTSIAVAAVPVPEVSASIDVEPKRVAVVNYTDSTMTSYETVDGREAPATWNSTVPYVDEDATIYTTGDGMFQFAYIRPSSTDGDEVAVVLGANVTNLPNGNLDIPDTVDAYKKYTANTTSTGYVAVSRNNKFLYYIKKEHKTVGGYKMYEVVDHDTVTEVYDYDPKLYPAGADMKTEYVETVTEYQPVLNEDGTVQKDDLGNEITKPVEVEKRYTVIPIYEETFRPCYYDTYSEWGGLDDNQLYYWDKTKGPNPNPPIVTASVASFSLEDAQVAAYTPVETATPSPTATIMPEATIMPVATELPTASPTVVPTEEPMATPTVTPTAVPTEMPTAVPTEEPTAEPTEAPTAEPTEVPTEVPTAEPTEVPTAEPSATPTAEPTPTQEAVSSQSVDEPESGEQSDSGNETAKGLLKAETIEYKLDNAIMADRSVNLNLNIVSEPLRTSVDPGTANTGTVEQDDPTQTEYFYPALDKEYQRIHDAKLQYIGRQYLEGSNGEWKIASSDTNGGCVKSNNPEDGVFAGKGQIANLTIGDNLLGIGDYAFYGCSGLNSVTLNNGLSTIGNGAFANCVNMTSCDMQLKSAIKIIGKDAFMNCRSLTSLIIPINVEAIGDYCFQGCDGLQNLELCGSGNKVLLSIIGYNAFENCANLTSIIFPDNFTQTYPYGTDWSDIKSAEDNKIPVTYFKGCTSLQFIKIQNSTLDIIDGTTEMGSDGIIDSTDEENDHKNYQQTAMCDIEEFLATVPSIFYFEAPDVSEMHETAKDHSAAFKYLNEDKFEKVVLCPEEEDDTTGAPHEATFIVNEANQLIEMEIDPKCTTIEIPANIGAHGVETVAAASFQNNCYLEKIYIPSTVNLIETNAFKGCHNLRDVIFTQPENAGLVILDQAFNTQAVDFHATGCDKKLDEVPVLTFTGTVSESSVPFQYAMNPANNINVGAQPETYITYYSGWPSNLTVQYNSETGKNELIDYPRYEELDKYTEESFPYMTAEYEDAAKNAVANYEAGKELKQNEQTIINSALHINLPSGIEAIAEGIFSGVDSEGNVVYELDEDGNPTSTPVEANKKIETITMNTVETVDPYTFAECESLKGFYMSGGNEIDDYAFKNCTALENVSVAPTVTELGIRPFAGCDKLTTVDFAGSPYFTCQDMVVYGLTDGTKTKIVECLEARGDIAGNTKVGPEELTGITEIAEEAFKDCDGIGSVDLTSSAVSTIPEQCFAQTDRLYSVLLPETAKSIKKGAFWNSKVSYMEIPSSVTLIEPEAFATVEEDADGEIILDEDEDATITNKTSGHSTVTFYCTEGDGADTYADNYYYINPTYYRPTIYHTVYFWDYENYPGTTQPDTTKPILFHQTQVIDGEDAVPPTESPDHEGYPFTGWTNYSQVTRDLDVYPMFGTNIYTVDFVNWDMTPLCDTQYVEEGKSATPPDITPTREGHTFKGWVGDYHNITKDTIIVADYTDDTGAASQHKVTFYNGSEIWSEQSVAHGGSAVEPKEPTKAGYVFQGWVPANFSNVTADMMIFADYLPESAPTPKPTSVPAPTTNPGTTGNTSVSQNNSATPAPTAAPRLYTVSVSGGSGSGQYEAGEIVVINAFDRGEGQNFDKWTSSTAGVGFANPEAVSTTFTMPAANVSVTATYKTGGATVTTPATTTGGTTNTGSSNNYNPGTTVQVTKPGISNTNLAGATVSGATDNFVVKVTEDQNATNAVVAALQARYGDISRIKYQAMDISLYDSTGRTKIADTSGISVNITLPLPDDLVQYAGNNKVAAVNNGTLEDLNVRFTTVDGVSCVNFTASHFSPYVIYVDTANLTQGTIDATPKTGDPIHPKWFLAIGMACVSLILFFKRDKKVVINSKMA
ncbi:MAG: leucine-rich repeat protein [Lachnospiraceae bacterium]|nr:leucine-rich repeat protein [Lachnospiraceae bacterium]